MQEVKEILDDFRSCDIQYHARPGQKVVGEWTERGFRATGYCGEYTLIPSKRSDICMKSVIEKMKEKDPNFDERFECLDDVMKSFSEYDIVGKMNYLEQFLNKIEEEMK